MPEERLYTKEDLERSETEGSIKHALLVFTNEFKDFKRDYQNLQTEIKELRKDMITRQEVKEELKNYVTNDKFNGAMEPQKKFMYGVISLVIGSFGTLIALLIAVVKYSTHT